MIAFFVIILSSFWLGSACSSASQATSYAELSKAEEAKQALDKGDYAVAIERYKELIEAEPENYETYRYLAAAYAAEGGFDIIEVAKASTSARESSGSLIDIFGSFLPKDPTAAQLESMRLSTATLLQMPSDKRSKTNTEVTYAAGAAMQLEFYQSAYSVMYINKFAQVTASGTLDPERLSTMSDQDVANILGSLVELAGQSGEGMGAAAQEALSQIDQQPGASQKEKLINYLNATQ